MVKKLSKEQMNEYIENRPDGLEFVSLNLQNSSIQEWIVDGRFAHIKKELQQYKNLEFGCLKEDNRCHYIFFTRNLNTYWRIVNLLDALFIGEKIPIYKCSTEDGFYGNGETVNVPPSGQYNACPLF